MDDPNAGAALLRRRAETEPLWVEVRGSSMGSRYRDVDRVLVASRSRLPRVGEIWLYCVPGSAPLAHRYFRRKDGGLQFQGDAHDEPDGPVPATWLVGQVTHCEIDGTRIPVRRRDALVPWLRAAFGALGRRMAWRVGSHRS